MWRTMPNVPPPQAEFLVMSVGEPRKIGIIWGDFDSREKAVEFCDFLNEIEGTDAKVFSRVQEGHYEWVQPA